VYKSHSLSIGCRYSGTYTAEIWKEDKRHVYAFQQSCELCGEPSEAAAQKPEIWRRQSPLLRGVPVHVDSFENVRAQGANTAEPSSPSLVAMSILVYM